MPRVTFLKLDGSNVTVDAQTGASLMQVAVDNLIPGILADCGGSCSCATCHAYIEAPWFARLPQMGIDETLTLEGALEVEPSSRLTCQIKLSNDLDGIVVRLPLSQG